MLGVDSHDLRVRSGGIRERPEHVEDRSNPHLPAGGRYVLHRIVKEGRVKKPYSNFVDASRNALRLKLDPDTQRFDDVGAPALRGHRAIAVLGYPDAGAGYNKRSCG
jgi:hypothetical protein